VSLKALVRLVGALGEVVDAVGMGLAPMSLRVAAWVVFHHRAKVPTQDEDPIAKNPNPQVPVPSGCVFHQCHRCELRCTPRVLLLGVLLLVVVVVVRVLLLLLLLVMLLPVVVPLVLLVLRLLLVLVVVVFLPFLVPRLAKHLRRVGLSQPVMQIGEIAPMGEHNVSRLQRQYFYTDGGYPS